MAREEVQVPTSGFFRLRMHGKNSKVITKQKESACITSKPSEGVK